MRTPDSGDLRTPMLKRWKAWGHTCSAHQEEAAVGLHPAGGICEREELCTAMRAISQRRLSRSNMSQAWHTGNECSSTSSTCLPGCKVIAAGAVPGRVPPAAPAQVNPVLKMP